MADGAVDRAPGMLGMSVCYASDKHEWLRELQVAPGTTIGEAIERSGVLEAFPDINLTTQPVGIYAKKKTLDTVLREHDRVEIYRPLVADPKESRRKRAAKKAGVSDSPAAPD
jgi:putative ubiquitin-RnfH superfamily antitoxin RatB of RatAB toxin-antitoxin module